MKIAQIVFFIAAVFKVSILVFPAREQIYIYYRMSRSTLNHTILSISITTVVFMVPCLYPDIDNILDILGGLFLGTLGFSVPVALYIASLWVKEKRNYFLISLNSGLLVLIVLVQLISTILTIFADKKEHH